MIARGQAIRARREGLGLSREALAADTRVPVDHIEAIEEGRFDRLPAGPYAQAWMRALEQRLGLEGPAEAASRPPAHGASAPLWLARVVAGGALGALLAAGAWQVIVRAVEEPPPAARAPLPADQELLVRALRNTRVRVVADGEVVREGPMAGGEEIEVRARERIELEVAAVGALRIDYNGERVVPQGRQDQPRRLVFVDDGERR